LFSSDPTGENIVVLKVENYIPKGAEEGLLTNDILEKIRTDAMSRNKSVLRASEPIAKRITTKRSTHSISTNSGLYHIHLACQGAAGSFDLHLGSRNGRNTVILEAFLPARQDAFSKVGKAASHNDNHAAVPDSVPLENSLQEFIPEGLKICVIDDSKVCYLMATRLMMPPIPVGGDVNTIYLYLFFPNTLPGIPTDPLQRLQAARASQVEGRQRSFVRCLPYFFELY